MRQRLFSLLIVVAAVSLDTPSLALSSPRPDRDSARGLVQDRLLPSPEVCEGGLLVDTRIAPRRCTHGPDPAPAGVDVRERRSVEELRDARVRAAAVPCHGDGSSGPRVEAIYAVASDRSDRFGQIAPLIEQWAAGVSAAVTESAALTGGERTVRFVTSGCRLVVRHEVLTPTGDDDIASMADELYARGYNRSDRRYHVWMDANVYCGVGYVNWLFARTDSGCWGSDHGSVELHELVHTLGGVNTAAPNATRGWHCTDESDRMCYSDSPDYPPMRSVCPATYERLLDCNGDDYFNVALVAGTWLAAHPEANAAEAPFLAAADGEPTTFLPPTPDDHRGPVYRLRLDNADDDLCAYAGAAKRRVFCIGYRGAREENVTGALLAVAENRRADLTLVGTNRGGGFAYGVRLTRDGQTVIDDRDGEAGAWSAAADRYEKSVRLDLNAPPSAAFAVSPARPAIGQTVTLTSESEDPERATLTTAWDLDGDGQADDATGPVVTTTFTTPGDYALSLLVTDDAGASDAASTTVTVVDSGPGSSGNSGGSGGGGATASRLPGSGSGGGSSSASSTLTAGFSDLDDWTEVERAVCLRAQHRVRRLRREIARLRRLVARASSRSLRRSRTRRLRAARRRLARAREQAWFSC